MKVMTTMTLMVAALFMVLTGGEVATAQTDASSADAAAKLKQLKRMADAIELSDIMEQKFREGVSQSMTDGNSMFSEEMMKEFAENVVERFNMDEFLETVALPVLDPYFTTDELTLVADFIETDLGTELISSAMEGKASDPQALLTSGDFSEEDGMKMMQLWMRLSSKKALLEKGDIGQKFQAAAAAYGESIAIDVMTEMMEEYSEGAE